MKLYTLLLTSFFAVSAFANTAGTNDNPIYKQCTVSLPDRDVAGVCKETGDKYFQIFTCEGTLLAFVEPGALPTIYGTTCGKDYKGFPN